MWHTSESAERRPTPDEPTSSRLPPGREDRSILATASSASGKSTRPSSFISRSYCLRPCATIFSKSATGARRSVSVASGEAPARSARPPRRAE